MFGISDSGTDLDEPCRVNAALAFDLTVNDKTRTIPGLFDGTEEEFRLCLNEWIWGRVVFKCTNGVEDESGLPCPIMLDLSFRPKIVSVWSVVSVIRSLAMLVPRT